MIHNSKSRKRYKVKSLPQAVPKPPIIFFFLPQPELPDSYISFGEIVTYVSNHICIYYFLPFPHKCDVLDTLFYAIPFSPVHRGLPRSFTAALSSLTWRYHHLFNQFLVDGAFRLFLVFCFFKQSCSEKSCTDIISHRCEYIH